MKILITGHRGYIGSHVIEEVRYLGNTPIRCEHRFENETKTNLYLSYNKPDALIHCAWSGLPNYTSIDHYNNVAKQYMFIERLVESGLKNVTVIGSCLETLETQCHYALAKRQLRQKLEQLPIKLKWPQLFYVYGSNEKKYKLLPQIKSAIERGQKTFSLIDAERDFIHIRNAAQAIALIAQQDDVTGRIEVGMGKAIPVIDFAKKYFPDMEYTLNYPKPEYEPYSFCANIEKLNQI